MVGYYDFMLTICVRIFIDNLSKCQWIFTKLGICIDLVDIWFGVANGQFFLFLTVIWPSPSVFLFLDNNLIKYQWIFIKLGMCIDNVKIWFEIANAQILSILNSIICLPQDNNGVLSFHVFIVISSCQVCITCIYKSWSKYILKLFITKYIECI